MSKKPKTVGVYQIKYEIPGDANWIISKILYPAKGIVQYLPNSIKTIQVPIETIPLHCRKRTNRCKDVTGTGMLKPAHVWSIE